MTHIGDWDHEEQRDPLWLPAPLRVKAPADKRLETRHTRAAGSDAVGMGDFTNATVSLNARQIEGFLDPVVPPVMERNCTEDTFSESDLRDCVASSVHPLHHGKQRQGACRLYSHYSRQLHASILLPNA